MATFTFSGTCCKEAEITVENNIITSVEFKGGCPGNLLGIKKLVENRSIEEVVKEIEGIPCRDKDTSCPDQLAKALKKMAV